MRGRTLCDDLARNSLRNAGQINTDRKQKHYIAKSWQKIFFMPFNV